MRFFLLLAAAAPLFAQTCTYTASPNGFTFGSDGTGASSTIKTQAFCSWTATTAVTWIHLVNTQGLGQGGITFNVDPNPGSQLRSGTILVGDQSNQTTLSVSQFAANCATQIAPPLSVSVPVSGGGGTLQVTSGCPWQGSSPSWVKLSPAAPLVGNNSVDYTVAANGCVASRTGAVSVQTLPGGGTLPTATFQINQAGSPDNLSLSPGNATVGPGTATGRITVTTGDTCPWSSFSDASWLHITANSGSGSGVGAITYAIDANIGPPRTGHLTVGPQVFTVVQQSTQAASPVLSVIVNAASGISGAIAPGEIISLFGTNIGPTAGVAFGQTIPISLGGVQVMFGTTPAALTYVSAGQINAIAPFGLAPGGTVPIQVQYQGQSSNALTASVQAAVPAIFSTDMSGRGPGAILNSDYTKNSTVDSAPSGSVVMIYVTGGGATSPPSADAAFAPSAEPFPRLTQQVSVEIAGLPAQMTYAGGAPGLVNGLVQINAVVPNGVVTGPLVPLVVPVVVKIGGVPTQSGITMAVR